MLDFIRVASAVPPVTVGDTVKNAEEICRYICQADKAGCDLVVFPELALTGYTCADLFFQQCIFLVLQPTDIDDHINLIRTVCNSILYFKAFYLFG